MKKALFALALLVLLVPAAASAADYVIGEGDGIQISVWGEPELTVAAQVRPDGKVSMPGIGDVVAAGFTPDQLTRKLTERLSTLVKAPIVTVMVQNFLNSNVYVVGGGVESAVIPLLRRTTLLQLLASLGSLEDADLHASYVFRDGKKVREDFDTLFHDGKMDEDLQLHAGDMVFMPLKRDRNVFVLGAVGGPRAIPAREGLTALEAILEAGGYNRFADEKSTTIIRRTADGVKRIKVNGQALIEKGDMSQNVVLEPGDYIIVNESFF